MTEQEAMAMGTFGSTSGSFSSELTLRLANDRMARLQHEALQARIARDVATSATRDESGRGTPAAGWPRRALALVGR
jgi:hypothetical protein